MDETTRIENTPNEPIDGKPVKTDLSSSTMPKSTWSLRIQSLDAIAAFFKNVFKGIFFALLLLALIFIFINIPTQQGGIVIQPFEISKNENLSGTAIADQLTAELMRIQQTHNITREKIILPTNGSVYTSELSAEPSLGNRKLFVPKVESVDTGSISVASNSLDPGKLMIAFKSAFPGNKPVTKMRGSLQRYGSTIVLVALLEGSNVQSWTIRQSIDGNNGEQFDEMISNLSFMIALNLPQSNVSAKTWEGLKYYTEALYAYNQYKLSGKPNYLSQAANYSLMAISSEKGYKNPFNLLFAVESTYAKMRRYGDAIEYCNKSIEIDPTSNLGWQCKGAALDNQGKYDEAIKAYEEAIRLDPKDADAWNNKGATLNNQGRYDEAITALDKAILLNPDLANAYNNKGAALDNQGKYDEAIKAYNESIRLNPNANAWSNIGFILYKQSKYDEAITALDKAILLNPDLANAYYNKGAALDNQGKYDEATKAYEEAIRLDHNYAKAWNNIGVILYTQSKYDEAITALDKAILLNPDLANAYYNKGAALDNQGKYDEATKAYEEAIGLDHNYAKAWNNIGVILYTQSKYDEAIQAFDKAIELDPKLAAARNNKGLALAAQGK
jgi:tetratricopeptide (TPR) repeat protein